MFLLPSCRHFYAFWILSTYQRDDLQILSPIPLVAFLLDVCVICTEFLVLFSLFFFFKKLCFCIISRKSLPNVMSWSFFLMFASKSFEVSGLTFRPVIHLEWVFIYGIKVRVHLYSFVRGCPVSPAPFVVEEIVFSPWSGHGTVVENHLEIKNYILSLSPRLCSVAFEFLFHFLRSQLSVSLFYFFFPRDF